RRKCPPHGGAAVFGGVLRPAVRGFLPDGRRGSTAVNVMPETMQPVAPVSALAGIEGLRLAVVIATYGREQVLVDTIRQVLCQEPPPDEILIVDQTREHHPATTGFLVHQACLGAI